MHLLPLDVESFWVFQIQLLKLINKPIGNGQQFWKHLEHAITC